MLKSNRALTAAAVLFLALSLAQGRAQAPPAANSPIGVTVYDRTRIDTWQWFAAPPQSETYVYVESLLRIGVQQKINH